ncbi:hypothetical protein SKAU_G00054480 [Synaphobranchus kaupii]|uniref:Secreted protein n=1 Tax=Synaphobranchus kaupii TaxID=118154 RepID=A0A9Q1J9R9_SYNKA|nr:hypothetical protein SKAU_G00054480 [Synaphobranchus kaupii]
MALVSLAIVAMALLRALLPSMPGKATALRPSSEPRLVRGEGCGRTISGDGSGRYYTEQPLRREWTAGAPGSEQQNASGALVCLSACSDKREHLSRWEAGEELLQTVCYTSLTSPFWRYSVLSAVDA